MYRFLNYSNFILNKLTSYWVIHFAGVMDDRGKFIYISQEELERFAKFIKQRGRVQISELVENSSTLINLTPVEAET